MLNKDIENNDDDKELTIDQEMTDEEVDMETTVEKVEGVVEGVQKKAGFFPRLIAGFIDQTLLIALALGLLFLFDAILRLIGYYVVDRASIFFIIYVIVNVIYPSITESTKLDGTLGKWLLKIK